jgi:small subunit ribosomal protein S6
MMRDYEVIFIVHPDLEQTAFDEVVDRVQGWITAEGGEVTNTDLWGKRKLAYPIRKKAEGQYVLMETRLSPSSCATIERNLRLLEPIMRFLIAKKE